MNGAGLVQVSDDTNAPFLFGLYGFLGRPENVVVWLCSAIGIWRQAGPVEDRGFNQNGHRVFKVADTHRGRGH